MNKLFVDGYFRWNYGYQAGLRDLYKWIRFSLGASYTTNEKECDSNKTLKIKGRKEWMNGGEFKKWLWVGGI